MAAPLPDPQDQSDPSAQGGAAGLRVAVLALVVAFGVPIDPEQETAILRVALIGVPLLTAWVVRRRAWKPSSVTEVAADATQRGQEDARDALVGDDHGYEPDYGDTGYDEDA